MFQIMLIEVSTCGWFSLNLFYIGWPLCTGFQPSRHGVQVTGSHHRQPVALLLKLPSDASTPRRAAVPVVVTNLRFHINCVVSANAR